LERFAQEVRQKQVEKLVEFLKRELPEEDAQWLDALYIPEEFELPILNLKAYELIGVRFNSIIIKPKEFEEFFDDVFNLSEEIGIEVPKDVREKVKHIIEGKRKEMSLYSMRQFSQPIGKPSPIKEMLKKYKTLDTLVVSD